MQKSQAVCGKFYIKYALILFRRTEYADCARKKSLSRNCFRSAKGCNFYTCFLSGVSFGFCANRVQPILRKCSIFFANKVFAYFEIFRKAFYAQKLRCAAIDHTFVYAYLVVFEFLAAFLQVAMVYSFISFTL